MEGSDQGEIRYLAPDGQVVGRLRSSGTPGSFHLYRGDQMVGTISLPDLLPSSVPQPIQQAPGE
jgi:hypothetical protein